MCGSDDTALFSEVGEKTASQAHHLPYAELNCFHLDWVCFCCNVTRLLIRPERGDQYRHELRLETNKEEKKKNST